MKENIMKIYSTSLEAESSSELSGSWFLDDEEDDDGP